MTKKNVNLEWYVMNSNRNSNQIESYNIFNNIRVYEDTLKLCEKYKKEKMTLTDFTEELRMVIMHEEWGRCEYEIMVGGLFADDNDYQKIDCYQQVLPNISILAQYVLHTYYPRLEKTNEN